MRKRTAFIILGTTIALLLIGSCVAYCYRNEEDLEYPGIVTNERKVENAKNNKR